MMGCGRVRFVTLITLYLQVVPLHGMEAGLDSVLFSPVGSDTTVGGLGCSTWGFLQISFSYSYSYTVVKVSMGEK